MSKNTPRTIDSVDELEVGEMVSFMPNEHGGEFPTGETTRRAEVEAIRGDEAILRQRDDVTKRATAGQILR